MQKTLIAIIILVLIGAGLYYVLTQYQPNPDTLSQLTEQEGERQLPDAPAVQGVAGEVRGTIVSVNTEQAMVDGPYLITLRQSSGAEAVIAVPSMGLPLCAAREKIVDVYALTPGQTIAVRGTVGEGGVIIPCESAEHYLELVEPN